MELLACVRRCPEAKVIESIAEPATLGLKKLVSYPFLAIQCERP
jgi:hypothetical protein